MDQTLIYFLIGCVFWAALLYYLFVIRKAPDLGAGGKSAFIVVTALLIPVLGFTLWNQNASHARLQELGFAVYQGFENNVGVASGTGSDPTWLYAVSSPPDAVLEFYRRPENHSGWKLRAETANALVFQRGDSMMRLQVSNEHVAFSYTPGAAQSDKDGDDSI